MVRLLLDSHVPVTVVHAVKALQPALDIHHVATWQEGAYINAEDPVLLEACWQDDRALVSKDRATLPGWIALRIAEGKEHGGVVFYDLERFRSHQVGALAKAIVSALKASGGRLANRWITLR